MTFFSFKPDRDYGARYIVRASVDGTWPPPLSAACKPLFTASYHAHAPLPFLPNRIVSILFLLLFEKNRYRGKENFCEGKITIGELKQTGEWRVFASQGKGEERGCKLIVTR